MPADVGAGGGDLVGAKGAPWHVVAALFVGGAQADDRLAADQAGLVRDRLGGKQRGFDGFGVMAVHSGHHVPAIGFEPLGVSSVNQPWTWPSIEMPLSS